MSAGFLNTLRFSQDTSARRRLISCAADAARRVAARVVRRGAAPSAADDARCRRARRRRPISSRSSPSTSDASAPIGVWQPPPSAATSARSAVERSRRRCVVDPLDTASLIRRVVARESRSRRCPGPAPARRRRPASTARCATRSRAGVSPGGRQHQRVVRACVELSQPRVEIAADRRETARSETAASAARCGARCRCRSTASAPSDGHERVGRCSRAERRGVRLGCRQHDRVQRVFARQHAGDRQPLGQHRRHVLAAVHGEVDRRRRSSASSISLTKSRLPPISDSGASCSRSPAVLMTTIRQVGPPAAAMRAATVCACHSASWLPRVPRRSS